MVPVVEQLDAQAEGEPGEEARHKLEHAGAHAQEGDSRTGGARGHVQGRAPVGEGAMTAYSYNGQQFKGRSR